MSSFGKTKKVTVNDKCLIHQSQIWIQILILPFIDFVTISLIFDFFIYKKWEWYLSLMLRGISIQRFCMAQYTSVNVTFLKPCTHGAIYFFFFWTVCDLSLEHGVPLTGYVTLSRFLILLSLDLFWKEKKEEKLYFKRVLRT